MFILFLLTFIYLFSTFYCYIVVIFSFAKLYLLLSMFVFIFCLFYNLAMWSSLGCMLCYESCYVNKVELIYPLNGFTAFIQLISICRNSIKDTDVNCSFCLELRETLLHLFWSLACIQNNCGVNSQDLLLIVSTLTFYYFGKMYC